MLSRELWEPLFGTSRPQSAQEVSKVTLSEIKKSLSDFGLWNRVTPPIKDTPLLQLPKLSHRSLKESVESMAAAQIEELRIKAEQLARASLPSLPTEWKFSVGWTRYDRDGTSRQVSCPLESALVFDTENCPRIGHQPVIAVAVSERAWYSWCSAALVTPDAPAGQQRELIRMADSLDEEKLIVGHHVSYDRQRIFEEYSFEPSRLQFLDTMSMHTATSGLSSQQHALWKKSRGQASFSKKWSSTLGYQVRTPHQRCFSF
jgi:DNA polymerase gamma 1